MNIQKEIDNAVSKGLKEVVLPQGEYIIKDTIVLPSDFTLRVEETTR